MQHTEGKGRFGALDSIGGIPAVPGLVHRLDEAVRAFGT